MKISARISILTRQGWVRKRTGLKVVRSSGRIHIYDGLGGYIELKRSTALELSNQLVDTVEALSNG